MKHTLSFCIGLLLLLFSFRAAGQGVVVPKLLASSYTSASVDDLGNSACPDGEGNMYLVSAIFRESTGQLVATPGVVQTKPTPPWIIGDGYWSARIDMGIIKFNEDLSDVLFFTYLGSAGLDYAGDVAVDPETNDLYMICGSGHFYNFPTTANAYMRELIDVSSNQSHVVLCKLSADGTRLVGSTYLDGSWRDGGALSRSIRYWKGYFNGTHFRNRTGRLTIDTDGKIVGVVGTGSDDFPVTIPRGLPPDNDSGRLEAKDMVVFKMNEDLSSLEWSTYLGGGSYEKASGLATSQDFVYVFGTTLSTHFEPVARYTGGENASNVVITSDGRKYFDTFVVALPKEDLVAGAFNQGMNIRFLGGDPSESSYFLALDTADNVYAVGKTKGEYPVENTNGRFHYPGREIFMHKLSPDLLTSHWAITFGTPAGENRLKASAFHIDPCDNIHLTGIHWAMQFEGEDEQAHLPTTSNALRRSHSGRGIFYSIVLGENAEQMLYASYFGGNSGVSIGSGFYSSEGRYDKGITLYQSASVDRPWENEDPNTPYDFPTTPNAFGTEPTAPPQDVFRFYGSRAAGFKMRFGEVPVFTANTPIGGQLGIEEACAPQTLVFTPRGQAATSGGQWEVEKEGEGVLFAVTKTGAFDFTFLHGGTYIVRFTPAKGDCYHDEPITKTIRIQEPKEYQLTDDLTLCEDDNEENNTAKLTIRPTDPNATGARYDWTPRAYLTTNSGAEVSTTPLPRGETAFQVTITDGVCVSKEQVSVRVVPKPVLAIRARFEGLTSCRWTNNVRLDGNVRHADTFYWEMGDGTPAEKYENIARITHEYAKKGTYTVQLVGERDGTREACRTTVTEKIQAINPDFPNVFTPNNDGINDYFQLPGLSDNETKDDYEVRIYDRLGNMVYENKRYKNQWNAEGLPADVYFYTLTIPRKRKNCKGWLHVVK